MEFQSVESYVDRDVRLKWAFMNSIWHRFTNCSASLMTDNADQLPLRMWGWLTFSDLRRQCPRCHIDTAAVLLVLYMLIKQIFNYIVDFRRQDGHYRQMTFFTDQYLKCCCQFQKHNLKIFNAPNILPLPLICRRKRADFVRVNETSTFLNIDFDDYLWKCVFTNSGFF